jgi:hypothetical protein
MELAKETNSSLEPEAAPLTLEGTSVRYSAGMIWSVSMFCAQRPSVSAEALEVARPCAFLSVQKAVHHPSAHLE